MNSSVQLVALDSLAVAFVPVLAVVILLHYWSSEGRQSLYGLGRMLLQLLVIGYFLTYLFESDNSGIVLAVLTVMVVASSWIALRTNPATRASLYLSALVSVVVGGGFTLLIISQGVLALDPWYTPKYLVPLAGMIFGGSMNSLCLAAERMEAELAAGANYLAARGTALRAGMIPITNSLFAVGLVSLPGMMTGQILSGISPLVAVRYQIIVMCMMFAAAGLSTGCFLVLAKTRLLEGARNEKIK